MHSAAAEPFWDDRGAIELVLCAAPKPLCDKDVFPNIVVVGGVMFCVIASPPRGEECRPPRGEECRELVFRFAGEAFVFRFAGEAFLGSPDKETVGTLPSTFGRPFRVEGKVDAPTAGKAAVEEGAAGDCAADDGAGVDSVVFISTACSRRVPLCRP